MKRNTLQLSFSVLLLWIACLPLAHGEVIQAGENSFTIKVSVETRASAEQAWAAMTQRISEWWSGEHSWSGDANNFYVRAELGGCFCEHLPASEGSGAGGVEHLRIMYIKPYEVIRFDGTLGPMVDMPVWTHELGHLSGSGCCFRQCRREHHHIHLPCARLHGGRLRRPGTGGGRGHPAAA
jgi:hypothetical protein